MPLDNDAQVFRDDLRAKAEKKRKLAKLALAKKPAKNAPPDSALVAVRNALQALTDLIVAQGHGKTGAVKFEVTERDLNGNIKSFKAE